MKAINTLLFLLVGATTISCNHQAASIENIPEGNAALTHYNPSLISDSMLYVNYSEWHPKDQRIENDIRQNYSSRDSAHNIQLMLFNVQEDGWQSIRAVLFFKNSAR